MLRMGMYVTAGALAVLALVQAPGTGPVVAANSLQVLSSLAELAAGVALFGCWRLGGRAITGWLGVALADRGVLSVAHHSLDNLRIGPVDIMEPFGRLVVCVIVAAAIYAAVRTPEVDSAFAPLRSVVVSVAFGLAIMVVLDRTSAHLGVIRDNATFQRASLGACAVVWLLVAIVACVSIRRGARSARLWTASYLLLLAVSSGLEATFALSPQEIVVEHFVLFLAACLILVAAAWELRSTAQSQDRYALTLRLALARSEEETEKERRHLDEQLHDLRNAVSALRSADQTLRRYGGRLDVQSKHRLADALTSELSRLQTLIEPARPQRIEPFLLPEALQRVIDTERTCGSVILAEVPFVSVRGDRDGLAQVVQNLFVNSRKYAPGSPTTLSADRSGDRIVIRVSDRGPGIPRSERESIFVRGWRGSTSAGTEGSGIGLYTASQLMSAMGGSLALSDTEAGTTFLIELPLHVIPLGTLATRYAPDQRRTGVLN